MNIFKIKCKNCVKTNNKLKSKPNKKNESTIKRRNKQSKRLSIKYSWSARCISSWICDAWSWRTGRKSCWQNGAIQSCRALSLVSNFPDHFFEFAIYFLRTNCFNHLLVHIVCSIPQARCPTSSVKEVSWIQIDFFMRTEK